jgi:hypothetical protein
MEKILPIKTKIVAWWMIFVLSIISLFIGFITPGKLLDFVSCSSISCVGLALWGGALFGGISFFLILYSGISLLKKKIAMRKFSIEVLSLYLIISIIGFTDDLIDKAWGDATLWFIVLCLYLIPFVLLFFDRKIKNLE